MRIAHVTDFYLPRVGGIEQQVQHLARRQVAAGHDVHVVTSTPGDDHDRDGAAPRLHRLGSARVPHLGPVSPRAWLEVPALLRTLTPDVVHVHASVGSPLALIAGLSGRRERHPTVITVHSMWAHLSKPYRMLFTAVGLDRLPIVWTAVSAAAAAQVQLAVGPGHHVRLLPNGIDPQFWAPRRRREPRTDVHVAAVLRLAARKRPLALLSALRRSRAALPDEVRLRASVIGDGPLRDAARRYVARHGMHWVELQGTQPRERVREVLHDADIFVATARLESFGIAALEARCAGVPVVALTGTGVADFITHGREGLLADGDEDLVAALTRLAGSPDARATITAHCRAAAPRAGWAATLAAADSAYAAAAALVTSAPRTAAAAEAG